MAVAPRDRSPSPTGTGVPYDQWRRAVMADGCAGLKAEYAGMKTEAVSGACTAWQKHQNCNGYQNVTLVDSSRVILQDGLEGDYVHASYVDGLKRKKAYILAQAPLRNTVREYWRMVWQEKVQVCVCLTSLIEDDVEKSSTFFPTTSDRPFRAGPFRVILLGIEEMPSPRRVVTVRLKLVAWFLPPERRDRNVSMVFYGEWPDRGVPENPVTFLDVFDGVVRLQKNVWKQHRQQIDFDKSRPMSEPPPLLINCSAGIGRSATLAACLIEVERVRDTQRVHSAACVRKIRQQRAGAVQNVMQYVFVARVITEASNRISEDEATPQTTPSTSVINKLTRSR